MIVAYPYLLTIFGFLIGVPVIRAIGEPEPKHVQAAIKAASWASSCWMRPGDGFVGWYGLLIVLLLPPAIIIGKRVYSTYRVFATHCGGRGA